MDKTFEAKYHSLESAHWWFRARREMVSQLMAPLERTASVLELGCSGGVLIEALASQGFSNITGIDISEEAIAACQRRGLKNIFVMPGEKLEFKDQSFDMLVASDVLEHIEDEAAAIKEWKRVLKPNGTLIIFVPAFPFLWSGHDEVNHHQRRYTRDTLLNLLQRSGFSVERSSYWNFLLFFPVAPIRLGQRILGLHKRNPKDQLKASSPVINQILFKTLQLENNCLKAMNFPFGVSVWAVAKTAS